MSFSQKTSKFLENRLQERVDTKTKNENLVNVKHNAEMLFDNLPKLLRPEEAADFLRIKASTIYNWKYRGYKYGVPNELFLKFNGLLYLKSDVLRDWFASQNPSVN